MSEAFGADGINGVPRPRHTGAGGLRLPVRVRQVWFRLAFIECLSTPGLNASSVCP